MSTLAGKVIAITGAGSGIGLACAKLLSARGAYLALADVNLPALEAAAKTISNTGSVEDGKIMLCGLDVRDRVAVRSFYETTKAHFGTLYGCANIAGVLGKNSNIQRIWEVDPAEYKVTMEVNTDGVWNCLAEQLKPSIMENGGSIVNMASTAGLVGLKLNAPYCASKFAVVGLTKASAQDAGDRSIRVNCVCPGPVETPMLLSRPDREASLPSTLPLQRRATADEVAGVVAFLLGPESAYVTGSAYSIDGGWQC